MREENSLALTRKLNDEIPLACGNVGAALEMAGHVLADGNGAIEAPVGWAREQGRRSQTGEPRAGRVACGDVEKRGPVSGGRYPGVDLPMPGVLHFRHGDVTFKLLPSLVGTFDFHAAER